MELVIPVLLLIINGVIWGYACQQIIENRGYNENWFLWGFFFSLPAALVALSKPQKSHAEEALMSQISSEKQEKDILKNGGWKCNYCGRANASYVGTCACGKTKTDSEA